MSTVERGTVKWFNDAKGFGFINHHSGKDIFVHFSVIEGEGFKTLKDGELVEYEATEGPKGLNASRVIRISQNEGAPASAPANGLAQEIEVIRTEEPSTSHTSDPTAEGGSREETRFTEFSQDLEERELDPSKEQQIVSPVRDENGESLKTSTTLS